MNDGHARGSPVPASPFPARLRVLVVAGRVEDARLAARVLDDHGDDTTVASDAGIALGLIGRERFDVALVSLAMPRGDGLALVHHVRALHPTTEVIVLAHATEVAETSHAMALGVLGHVLLPLTGDALIVAIDRVRERKQLFETRARFARLEAGGKRRTATYARCAAFVSETDTRLVAARVLDATVAELNASAGAIYVPHASTPGRYPSVARCGSARLPEELSRDDIARLDPTDFVQSSGDRVRLALFGDTGIAGVVDLVPGSEVILDDAMNESLELIAALATASLAAAQKVEAVARTGIKDPETSAYTFAYFGDAAGREIDRATRHGRRFALLTIGLDGIEALRERLPLDRLVAYRREVTDAILGAVRDSDLLAHVDDDEFYLLLPETGLLGALACRRRIARGLAAVTLPAELAVRPTVGISVFPADGKGFGPLLRASRTRAEWMREGALRRLGLESAPFWTAVEVLVGSDDHVGITRDGSVSLHDDLVRAHDAMSTSRHAVLPKALLARIGRDVALDVARRRAAGTLYVAGDAALAAAALGATSMFGADGSVRAWALGSSREHPDLAAKRMILPIEDPRLDSNVLFLALTEAGAYALLGRAIDESRYLVFHSSDLDLVDALVNGLQSVYHLQPELR